MKKSVLLLVILIALSYVFYGQSSLDCHTGDNPLEIFFDDSELGNDYLNYIPNSDFNYQNNPYINI